MGSGRVTVFITTTMSNAIAKREARAARLARIEAGTCKECDNPRGINENGTPSVFCDDHRSMFRHQTARKKPKQIRDAKPNAIRYDSDGDPMTYLDSADFASYCKAVLGCISRDMATDMATIKNAMGEAYDVRRHQDALDSLRAIGEIELAWGYRPRYIRTTPRVISTAWNKDQSTTPKMRVPRPDHASLYPREATA